MTDLHFLEIGRSLEIGLRQWKLADRQIGPSDPINENSTQVYTISTHDDNHFSGKMSVDDHLLDIDGSLEKKRNQKVSPCEGHKTGASNHKNTTQVYERRQNQNMSPCESTYYQHTCY